MTTNILCNSHFESLIPLAAVLTCPERYADTMLRCHHRNYRGSRYRQTTFRAIRSCI